MKTKKVLLGALVFVFAAGTAFASLYQNPDTFISVLVPALSNNDCTTLLPQCKNIGQYCSNPTTGELCKVRVSVPGGNTVAQGFKENTCTLFYRHPASVPINRLDLVACTVLTP